MPNLNLSAVELENFKCFRRQRFELRNLTVLAGLNGVGKSSVIQALLLIRQSLSGNRMRRQLLLSGELVELGTGVDVLYDLSDQDELCIVLEFGNERRTEYRYQYTPESNRLSLLTKSLPTTRGTFDAFKGEDGNWVQMSQRDRTYPHRYSQRAMFSTRGFQYLSAERQGPRKSLPWSEDEVARRSLGTQGEHVLSFLSEFGRDPVKLE